MIKVGIVGGTGYTGVELLRLLAQHPEVEIAVITSRGEAGLPVATMFPNLRGHVDLTFAAPDLQTLLACDVVFFATPNGIAMQQVPALLAAGIERRDRVIALGGGDPRGFKGVGDLAEEVVDVLESCGQHLMNTVLDGVSVAHVEDIHGVALLADALNAERIAGAGLDVLAVEPPPADHPLLTARHCYVTPHIAWASDEAQQALADQLVDNIERFVAGQPLNVVTH